jgi:hypothetical protein
MFLVTVQAAYSSDVGKLSLTECNFAYFIKPKLKGSIKLSVILVKAFPDPKGKNPLS